MKGYKGFRKDLTCHGFQYEEGKEYVCDKAILCEEGFHFCTMPLDVFRYYHPSNSVYHEVEGDGEIHLSEDGDSKVACTKIKIGAEISISGLIKDQLNILLDKINEDKTESPNDIKNVTVREWSSAAASGFNTIATAFGCKSSAATSGNVSIAATSDNWSSAAASGDWSNAVTSGHESSATASGYWSCATSSGNESSAAISGYDSSAITYGGESSAAASGYKSNAITSGDESSAASSGIRSNASVSGNGSSAATSGDESSAVTNNKNSIALSCGKNSRAKGVIGSYIVLTEWSDNKPAEMICAKMIKITGKKYKPGVWYTLKDGKVVKHENQKEDWNE